MADAAVAVEAEPLHAAILGWYRQHARRLPWRGDLDPYHVLVSEVMLQQTQVDRVIPKYLEFLARFPTMRALAAATTAEVLRVWSPLGYNLRAVRLHRIALEVRERHGGTLPGTFSELLKLPGLGPYTARAVACFGYRQPVAVVDTNVWRVLSRLTHRPDRAAPTPRGLQQLADGLLPAAWAADWNQALMDLGAAFCRERAPRCLLCPARQHCGALRHAELPRAAEAGPHYHAERFRASNRFYRGRVVEALRRTAAGAWISLNALRAGVPSECDGPRLERVVRSLAADGLVEVSVDGGELQVRLPEQPA